MSTMMMLLLFVLLNLSSSIFCDVSYVTQTTESNKLSSYSSFSDVQMLSFDVPEDVTTSSWKFYLQHESDCDDQHVIIYLRYGSFPVINPYNSSFPKNFHVNTDHTRRLDIKAKQSARHYINISTPLPGTYYSAAYIKGDSNRIHQQGLSSSCKASLGVFLQFGIENPEILSLDSTTAQEIDSSTYYKFAIPLDVQSVKILITNCSQVQDSLQNSSCPIAIAYSPLKLPNINQTNDNVNCTSLEEDTTCTLTVSSFSSSKWNYVFLSSNTNQTTSFNVVIETTKCKAINASLLGHQDVNSTSSNNVVNQCYDHVYPTKSISSSIFKYVLHMPPRIEGNFISYFTNVSSEIPTLVSFALHSPLDIGGTITLDVVLFNEKNATDTNVTLNACLQTGIIPSIYDQNNCSSLLQINLKSNETGDASSSSLSIPFPEAGDWYLLLKTFCGNDTLNESSDASCQEESTIFFNIQSDVCVKGSCGRYGSCNSYISGGLIYSACVCTGGYRGWDCSDGSNALSDGQLLSATLLLTLSNLLFIPAVILSIYRRYLTEAVVYTFTMFFSTFYHACDSDVYNFCLMRGSVMQFCDFYASIMAFWVTVMALSDLPDYLRSFAHMVGALGIAFGVEYNRTGLWVFVVPFAVSIVIMTSSWVHQCRKQRVCYPEKKRWLFGIVPGVLLAGSGLVLFAFFETKRNYAYIHSAWHCATALSILVLLPFKKNNQGTDLKESNTICPLEE